MPIFKSDTLRSNNPNSFAIALANEIGGHRTVAIKQDLYALPDCILSASKINANSDALGQIWFVAALNKRFQLIDWNLRRSEQGWEEVVFNSQTDLTEVQNSIAQLQQLYDSLLATQQEQAQTISSDKQELENSIDQKEQDAITRENLVAEQVQSLRAELQAQIAQLNATIQAISTGINHVELTPAQYAALQTKEANTLYVLRQNAVTVAAYIGNIKLWEIVNNLDSTAQDAFLSAAQGNLLNQKYLMNAALIQYLLDQVSPFAISYFRGSGIYEDGDTPTVQFQWAYTRPIVSQTFNDEQIAVNVTTKSVQLQSTPSVQEFTIHATCEEADLVAQVLHTDFAQIITSVDADSTAVSQEVQGGSSQIQQTVGSYTRQFEVEETIQVAFLKKVYYGASSISSLSNAQILALQQEFKLQDSQIFEEHEFNCEGGKYQYVFVPTENIQGTPACYIQGFLTTDVTISTLNVINAKGKTISYTCFKFPMQTVSHLKIEIK